MWRGTLTIAQQLAAKKLFHLVHPALRFGVVQLGVALADFLKFGEQFALAVSSFDWSFDDHMAPASVPSACLH